MKLNSSHLEAFYAIARTLNFTRAAEEIHVTQSALSQRIAKLEEELETTLFIRDRSSVKLTEAGLTLLRYCERALVGESELLETLKGTGEGASGMLRIGGFSSVMRSLVVPALKKIMHSNPNLSVEFFTKELRELNDLLRRSEVDYILTNQKSETPDIESIFLGIEENVLVASKKYSDLEIYLDHDPSDPTTSGFFRQNKGSDRPKKMRYLDDVYGLIDGVKNGYGKAILPRHLIENEKDLEIQEPKKILKVSVYLNFFHQPYYRKIHERVVQDIRTHFQERFSD
ncbi:MAG: LysR family transcriptional regulator [Bdellovibrionota bacterium]